MIIIKYCCRIIFTIFVLWNITSCDAGGSVANSKPSIAPAELSNTIEVITPRNSLSVKIGAHDTLVLIFASSMGEIKDFTLNNLVLPAGWSSSSRKLLCKNISTDNECTLTLNYSPIKVEHGTINLAFSYTDNTTAKRNGAFKITFSASEHNNLLVRSNVKNPVITKKGNISLVNVSFISDSSDDVIHNLVLTNLDKLPVGWSSEVGEFTCDNITQDGTCGLNLKYNPNIASSSIESFELMYSYINNAKELISDSYQISYRATSGNNIVVNASPSNKIQTVVNSHTEVTIDFSSDDNQSISNFSLIDGLDQLNSLGWIAPSSFTCDVLNHDNYSLKLTFAPTNSNQAGVTLLKYSYIDNSGESKAGSLPLIYKATTDNKVIPVVSVKDLTVSLKQTESFYINFETNDGESASNFKLNLSSLPTWITNTTTNNDLNCKVVSKTGCKLTLSYSPTTLLQSGDLTLPYTYNNNIMDP